MLSVIQTTMSVAGAVTGASWLSILLVSVAIFLVWAFEERIKEGIQKKLTTPWAIDLLGRRAVRIVLQLVVGVVLVWFAVVISSVSILQPNTFVGFTNGTPFKFGRYIATIARSNNPPGGYCPEATITGDIINTTEQEIEAWYGGAPIRVWTQSPTVDFNGPISFSGISPADGSHTNIDPGAAASVTITGQLDPSLCKQYQESDLQHLRRARINATTEIFVVTTNKQGSPDQSAQPIVFRDLPIALGD